MEARLTIGKVARLAGVGIETVRFYERQRLIEQPPRPSGGGFRYYPEATVRRIRFIRSAQQIGFTLRECGELLALQEAPNTDCGQVRESASAALESVNRKLEQLSAIKSALAALVSTCPGQGSIKNCPILQALDQPDGSR